MKYLLVLLLLPVFVAAQQTIHVPNGIKLATYSKSDSIYYDTIKVAVLAFQAIKGGSDCQVIFTIAQRKNTVQFPGRKTSDGYMWFVQQERTIREVARVLNMPEGWLIWETKEMNWK